MPSLVFVIFAALCLFGADVVSAGEVPAELVDNPQRLQVGLIHPERPPYYSDGHGTRPQGLFVELLEILATDLNIALDYKFLPQARLREYMKLGDLDIEPGIDPE